MIIVELVPVTVTDIYIAQLFAASDDKVENTITHLICKRAALNEVFLITKEISKTTTSRLETDITIWSNQCFHILGSP